MGDRLDDVSRLVPVGLQGPVRNIEAHASKLASLPVEWLTKCTLVADRLGEQSVPLKAGGIALPLFVSFGELGLIDRLADCKATCIVTKRSLVPKLERILPQLPALRTILVVDSEEDKSASVLSLRSRLDSAADTYASFTVDENTPSVLHYTSGSTGKPRGVLHRHLAAEHLRHTAKEVLQLERGAICWCTADHGWVTGTSYGIIAPWLIGATVVHFAGNFDAAAWMRILQDQRIAIWYTAPTVLRMLMAAADVDFGSYDTSALRHAFSVAEPLNPEVSRWTLDVLGREVCDTWFQTETGGIMIANRPGINLRHDSMGRPVTGIEAAILDDQGMKCPKRQVGRLFTTPSSCDSTGMHRSSLGSHRFVFSFHRPRSTWASLFATLRAAKKS